MFIPADQMPADARVWIFQSDREFTEGEEKIISSLTRDFVETWTAHQKELKASFEIRYHLFLIIMIDEKYSQASGCSIDKSVHLIRKIENDFSVSLMNRLIFAFWENDRIRLVKKDIFESMVGNGLINDDTVVFNNLIQNKEELDSKWEIPLRESWHASLSADRK